MKKVLSYVIWGTEGRYWNNLFYLLQTNSSVYPDFFMRFYVHRDSTENFIFKVLEEISKIYSKIEIEIIDVPYKGTKLTTWRMKPLWENNVDYLFCRDVDYAVNNLERKSVEYFLNQNECSIHGIRSYSGHSTPLMAGMCGFNTTKVLGRIQKQFPNFESYVEFGSKNVEYCKEWIWGCDQALLRDFFGHLKMFPLILDCPQFTAHVNIHGFNPVICLSDRYENIKLPGVNEKVLSFSSSKTDFTGQPWNCTVEDFRELMSLENNEMSDILRKMFMTHSEIRNFFFLGGK